MGNHGWGHDHSDRSVCITNQRTGTAWGRIRAPVEGDRRRAYTWTDIATPDIAAIDAHIQRADFVFVTHTHYDHILDVPRIALKTRATVIGTESTENVMRAYGVPEEQLITVRGGEDFQFQGFSLRVIPRYTVRSTTSTTLARRLPRRE